MAKTEVQIDSFPNADQAEVRLKLKYWILAVGFSLTVVIASLTAFYVPKAEIRDIVSVFTGGIVSTTLIYHVLNYHLNYEVNRIIRFTRSQKHEQTNFVYAPRRGWCLIKHKPDFY